MSNGDYLPNCTNCRHFRGRPDKHCSLHPVVLPSLGTETICGDWLASKDLVDGPHYDTQVNSVLKGEAFQSLEKGTLYYDASYAQEPVRLLYAELMPFRSLKNPIISVEAFHDDDYGWIAYLASFGRGDDTYSYFPSVGGSMVISLGERAVEFNVGESGRRYLYSSESPSAIREWLDKHVNVGELWRETLSMNSKYKIESGIDIFLEVSKTNRKYIAIPATYFYPERLRISRRQPLARTR